MGLFGRLFGKKSDDGSQAAKDEQLASIYEACSTGNLPVITDPPVILKRGETAHFVSPVSVVEQKTEVTTYRAYAGTRMKIGSLPIYLGGSAPKKVSNEALTPMGDGWLIITNKRVILSGTKINYSTPLDKITHWKRFTDAIQILWEGKSGGRFYKMDDPRPAALVLMTLISGVPSPAAVGLDSSMFPRDPEHFVGFAADGLIDIVVDLLDQGTDANDTKDEYGFTALIAAANNGHSDVVSLLLDRRADPDIRTEYGDTALMLAALEGHFEAVRLLLGAEAKVNIKNTEGATALMYAASNGHYGIVETLIQKGADVNAKTAQGDTAVALASEGGHKEVVDLLIAPGAKDVPDDSDVSQNPDYFVGAAAGGRVDIITQLLDNGTDVNLTTKDGDTALISAAIQGQLEVLQLLLERGAAINKKNKAGLTALMMAASEGRSDVVRLLAERSGEVNVKNKDGWTPLMIAALNGHREVTEILLQGGANPNAKTKDGVSALGAAVYGGHPEVAELLKAYGGK